ncbi:MAG: SRPBCC family protein [Bacteroidetes bacterium]|nr:MAG: SRPBCC family protein [Bacteroidota bacterium]
MKKSIQTIAATINATPEDTWTIIGAVDGVDKWLAPITACRVDGDKRYCSTDEGSFEEDILQVSHENRLLRYAIPEQHMIPVQNILGQMNVLEAPGGKAIVTWTWEFDVEEDKEQEAKEMLAMVGNLGISGIESLLSASAN